MQTDENMRFHWIVATIFVFLITLTVILNLNLLVFLYNNEGIPPPAPKYLVNTESCKLSVTEIRVPVPTSENDISWNTIASDCSGEDKLSEVDDTAQTIRIMPNYSTRACCFQEVLQVDQQRDDESSVTACKRFLSDTMNIDRTEMLLVRCGKKLNLEANFMEKKSVFEKVQAWAWEKVPADRPVPYSVVIIGIGSLSRSSAYRKLPKTLQFLTRSMGFTDFKGYHSLSTGTVDSFLGFLTGLTMVQVTENEPVSWDNYPFIWHAFNWRSYVTMYAVDAAQSFSYGNQSGFANPPTDYYIYNLLKVMRELRLNISTTRGTSCSSTESVPQFLLRYTLRFLTKFAATPTFSFTFLDKTSHADPNDRFQNLDTQLFNFFHALYNHAQIMEDAFIVFLSDHGPRDRQAYLPNFIEHGLPPLFIRLPNRIQNRYRFQLTLAQNSERLTSPYDIHQTMVHLITLTENQTYDTNMTSDRTSLLLPVPLNRTCETIHVDPINCVCNLWSPNGPITSLTLQQNVLRFLTMKLNEVISSSAYRDVCATWVYNENGMLMSQIIAQSDQEMDVLVQFKFMQEDAFFETKVKVFHKDPTKKLKLLGKIRKINLSGNQNHCIGESTELDREMSSLCICIRNTGRQLIRKPKRIKKRRKQGRKRKPKAWNIHTKIDV